MTTSVPIAILGATSALARDYILGRSKRCDHSMRLYARRPDAVKAFLAEHGLAERHVAAPLETFGELRHGGVINFVGVGDPARAQVMGASIFDATLIADNLALGHVRQHPDVPYIFLSSGAAFGSVFDSPVNDHSRASFPLTCLSPAQFYGIAKMHAEARHRGLTGATVIDIRVFSYVSRTMDVDARFLLAEMVAALLQDRVFRTNDSPLTRDFIHPSDLGALIDLGLSAPQSANMAVDAYSNAPITKAELIALMVEKFGLRVELDMTIEPLQATGAKSEYYSLSRAAAQLGYEPAYSSASGVVEEVGAMLGSRRIAQG